MKMVQSIKKSGNGQAQAFVWVEVHTEAALCADGGKPMTQAASINKGESIFLFHKVYIHREESWKE